MYKCSICPANFKTQKGLDNHKCRWYCKLCGAKLTTEKGYEKHLQRHESVQEVRMQNEEREIVRKEAEARRLKEAIDNLKGLGLFLPKYKEGDSVIVSHYRVTKPTHEMRHGRPVRVRYDERRMYSVDKMIIDRIIEPDNVYLIRSHIEINKPYVISYSTNYGVIDEGQIFSTIEAAILDAKTKSDKYKEDCDFASMCR